MVGGMVAMGGRRLWRRAVDFIFPAVCTGCDRRSASSAFCATCRRDIAGRRCSSCPSCGRALRSGGDHPCQRCIERPPPFTNVWACATYSRGDRDAPLARAIRRLKYDRDVSYARPLAQMMANVLGEHCDHDAIVPVPLHIDRLRWRGFNQAVVIARQLARRHRLPVEAMTLCRLRPTPPQVGLDEAERRRNIAGAFAMRQGCNVTGKKILLVDDVYTTGATVEECARVLMRGSARQVDVAVLARAS